MSVCSDCINYAFVIYHPCFVSSFFQDLVKFMSQASFYCEEKAKEFLRIYMASKTTW